MNRLFTLLLIAATLGGCQKAQTPATSAEAAPASTASKPEPRKVAAAAKTYDGPFGLAGGMPVSELEALGFTAVENRPALYTGKPPRLLQDAKEYLAVATPKAGVCRIVAHIPVAVVNGAGDQLRDQTDRLAAAMAVKYGKHSEKVNYIGQDVYRRNPEFWMMGLKEESILYAYDWNAGKTTQPLPDNMEGIEVAADTTRLDSGYVVVKYTFKNFKDCHKEMEARKADNL